MGNSFIFNKGNLKTNNVNINSDTFVGYGNGTVVNVGNFVANNCIIDGIGFDFDSSGNCGRTTINGGEYEEIRAVNLVINNGAIDYIHSSNTTTINNGVVNKLWCNSRQLHGKRRANR